jgi:hypothetical protein
MGLPCRVVYPTPTGTDIGELEVSIAGSANELGEGQVSRDLSWRIPSIILTALI